MLRQFWNTFVAALDVEVYPVQHWLYSGDHLDNEGEGHSVMFLVTDLLRHLPPGGGCLLDGHLGQVLAGADHPDQHRVLHTLLVLRSRICTEN